MPLDPDLDGVLASLQTLGFASFAATPRDTLIRCFKAIEPAQVPRDEEIRSSDETVRGPAGGLAVRVYDLPDGERAKPLLVFLHGGGWVSGTLDSYDALCRWMCRSVHAVVVSVAYRLAPRHPHPAALEDSAAATAWALDNAHRLGADASRVAIAGDSAGGNLALNVALDLASSTGPRLRALALIYPMLDASNTAVASTDTSWRRSFISGADVAGFYRAYAPNGVADPTLSPATRPGIAGLPPTFIQAAEYDPLRPDALRLAHGLIAAGAPVAFRPGSGLMHGFLGFVRVSQAARDEGEMLWRLVATALRN